MKKLFSGIVSIILMSLLFTGCFNSVENTPEEVTKAYVEALNNGDIDSFKEYSTKKHQNLLLGLVRMGCKKDSLNDCFKDLSSKFNDKVERIDVVSENANETILKVYLENKNKFQKFKLAKVDGKWKVNNEK